MTEPKLITLDARRRASLSGLGRPEHHRYLVAVDPDGTITLTPAVVVAANAIPADKEGT